MKPRDYKFLSLTILGVYETDIIRFIRVRP
jgi:hypothetical protein